MTDSLIDRIDTAFEKMRFRYPESSPRALYLTEEDWGSYDRTMSEAWGGKIHCFQYRGIDIRKGLRSQLISTHGCAVTVAKRLSIKTKAAA